MLKSKIENNKIKLKNSRMNKLRGKKILVPQKRV
jgi:hypothetical protein